MSIPLYHTFFCPSIRGWGNEEIEKRKEAERIKIEEARKAAAAIREEKQRKKAEEAKQNKAKNTKKGAKSDDKASQTEKNTYTQMSLTF